MLNVHAARVIKLMVAAENQGLIDDVIWGSATPPNDSSVAAAVGPDWDGKLLINAEFKLPDFDGPDTRLYNEVSAEYAPDFAGSAASARWAS